MEIAFLALFLVIGLGVVIGLLVVAVVAGPQWRRNNNSPVLTVPSLVVGKRQETTHHRRPRYGTTHHWSTYPATAYYVTFEAIQGGQRMEMRIDGREWGTLAEGDRGQLTFQGTRYKGFDRAPRNWGQQYY